jgi:sterol desaturase/sphingolipid hydroxylase (fatty acid hydroxylase superfamily)
MARVATAHEYQTVAFFGLVILFEVLERVRPAHEIDRWKDLKIDVLSFALALALNRVCKLMVGGFIAAWTPAAIVAAFARLHAWPGAVRIALAIVVVDFVIYWIHRAQHRFDTLWRTHAWHHSIEQLYWFSGFRTSFLHSFLYNIPQAAVPMLVFNLSPLQTGIAYSIGLFVQFWEHTNVRVDLGPLRRVVMTPKYHRVHHSAVEPRGKNLAPIFPVWDLLFGTYVDPRSIPEGFPLGLGEPIETRKLPRMVLGV